MSNILITKNFIKGFGKNSIFLINKKNFNNEVIKNYEKCLLPFKLNDLLSKIKILSLKKDYKSRAIFQVLDYQLDINKKVIVKNDLKLKLTEKEVTLLVYLIELDRPVKINELLKFLAELLNINSKIIYKNEKGNTGHYIKIPRLYRAKKGHGLSLRSRIDFHDGLLHIIQDIRKN